MSQKDPNDRGGPSPEYMARLSRTMYESAEQRARYNALGCSGCALCKPEIFGLATHEKA